MPFLAAALALALWRVGLWSRGLPLTGHVFFLAHPLLEQATRQLQAGTFPLWNPLSYCGSPLLADPQAEVFNPAHAAFRLFSFHAAFKLNLAVDVALACLFAYCLARRLGARRSAAALAGLLFSCGGFFYYHAPMVAQEDAMVWVPAALLFWSRGAAAPLGLSLALCYLGGNPVFTYIALAGCLALRPRRRALAAAAAGGALALFVAAAQLFPALALFARSVRSGPLSDAAALVYSVPPAALLRQVLQPLWNRSAAAFVGDPTITSFYVGLPALALAALGLRRSRAAALWAGAGLVLMLGGFTPVYPLLLRLAPGLSLFRFPAQWGCLAASGLASLAALGAERLPRPWRLTAAALVAVDLWAFLGQAQAPRAAAELFSLKPATLAAASAGARVAHTRELLDAQEGATPAADPERFWLEQNEGLVPSRGQAFGLREVVSYNLYEPRLTRGLARAALGARSPDRAALRFLGAGALVDGSPSGGYRVIPLGGAAPRVTWSGRLDWLSTGAPAPSPRESARAVATQETPTRLSVRVDSPLDGYQLWADTYDPGWRAYVDGAVRPALVANAGFRGVAVEAGARDVRWVYRSPAFELGAALALAALFAAAGVACGRGLCYP